MYVPRHFAADSDDAYALVEAVGAADVVTVADGTPVSSLVPVLWDRPADGSPGRLLAHLARPNDQWRGIGPDGTPALAVVHGPQAYVSPGWYATKAEHGRVVPTWNYTTAHLTGRLYVHDDVEWLRALVTRLTERHEARRPQPWAVTDAPPRFVDGQLRAIVGIELVVERVEAKHKLSQNRSADDRAGVVEGLAGETGADAAAVRELMSG
jgi:transcriptional regulator